MNFPGWQVQELPNLEQEPAEGGGGGGGGISPPAGDIGGTTSVPTVVSTHLTNPLPVAQGGLGAAVTTLTDAATIAVNAALGSVLPGHPRREPYPRHAARTRPDGQRITFEIIQDATGSRTLAYSGAYAFPGQHPVTRPCRARRPQRDFLSFVYDAGGEPLAMHGVGAGPERAASSRSPRAAPASQLPPPGYNALSPMTTTGDLAVPSPATATAARLAGNTTTQKQYLTSTGTGSAAQAPAWSYVPRPVPRHAHGLRPGVAVEPDRRQHHADPARPVHDRGGRVQRRRNLPRSRTWSSPSAGVLDVASTTGLPTSGTVWVAATGTSIAVVTYTGVSGGNSTDRLRLRQRQRVGHRGDRRHRGHRQHHIAGQHRLVHRRVHGCPGYGRPSSRRSSAASVGAAFGLLGHGGTTVIR